MKSFVVVVTERIDLVVGHFVHLRDVIRVGDWTGATLLGGNATLGYLTIVWVGGRTAHPQRGCHRNGLVVTERITLVEYFARADASQDEVVLDQSFVHGFEVVSNDGRTLVGDGGVLRIHGEIVRQGASRQGQLRSIDLGDTLADARGRIAIALARISRDVQFVREGPSVRLTRVEIGGRTQGLTVGRVQIALRNVFQGATDRGLEEGVHGRIASSRGTPTVGPVLIAIPDQTIQTAGVATEFGPKTRARKTLWADVVIRVFTAQEVGDGAVVTRQGGAHLASEWEVTRFDRDIVGATVSNANHGEYG